jgi:hypothetical protein
MSPEPMPSESIKRGSMAKQNAGTAKYRYKDDFVSEQGRYACVEVQSGEI